MAVRDQLCYLSCTDDIIIMGAVNHDLECTSRCSLSFIIMHYYYPLHIVILFLEMCICYKEPSEAEVFAVFLIITTSLTSITSCNHFT